MIHFDWVSVHSFEYSFTIVKFDIQLILDFDFDLIWWSRNRFIYNWIQSEQPNNGAIYWISIRINGRPAFLSTYANSFICFGFHWNAIYSDSGRQSKQGGNWAFNAFGFGRAWQTNYPTIIWFADPGCFFLPLTLMFFELYWSKHNSTHARYRCKFWVKFVFIQIIEDRKLN